MTQEDLQTSIAARSEALVDLIDMVQDRSDEDALELLTVLHEVAKLHVAGQMPQLNSVDNTADHLVYYSFAHRNVVTSARLFQSLKMLDDDGIPL